MSELAAKWLLVNRVRDASYDWFTIDEKKRMHNLVLKLKQRGTVSDDDIAWLRVMDANLRGVAALTGTFDRRRRKWHAGG